jgi:hypothetical protein
VAADGILNGTYPANTTQPGARMVVASAASPVYAVRFLTEEGAAHPDRLRGPVFLGLWMGPEQARNANLSATLWEVPASGSPKAIANASIALDGNVTEGDPLDLVPPNPSDPLATAYYEYFALYPELFDPPYVLNFGFVDVPVANESRLMVSFGLSQGSSPAPVPVGAFATIYYNYTGQVVGVFPVLPTLTFLFAPWYAPDPPRPTYSYSSTSTYSYRPPTRTSTTTGDDGGGGKDKDSPGAGAVLTVLPLLAVALWAMRRRL